MEKHAIQYQTKSEMAFDALKQLILNGTIVQGREYSIMELAGILGVSRTTVTRAVNELEEQGIVQLIPKVGLRVHPLVWEDIVEHSHMLTQMSKLVSKWCIEKATDEQIRSLCEFTARIRQAIDEGNDKEYFLCSREFYLAMCRLVRANRCQLFFQKSWEFEGWYAYNISKNKEALYRLSKNHEDIIQAMLERDVSKMEAVYDFHTECCLDLLRGNVAR